jgi:hypothetical protein
MCNPTPIKRIIANGSVLIMVELERKYWHWAAQYGNQVLAQIKRPRYVIRKTYVLPHLSSPHMAMKDMQWNVSTACLENPQLSEPSAYASPLNAVSTPPFLVLT